MVRCAALKPNGAPCERIVGASQKYCFAHDPLHSEERRRNASKAARSKPSKEIASVKRQLKDLADAILKGQVERSVGAVAAQVLNVYLRACEIERRAVERDEIQERISELERYAATYKKRRA